MQKIIAGIAPEVKITMGLTKEEEARSEYGGYYPVKTSVLEDIYKEYGHMQGDDVDFAECGSPVGFWQSILWK